MSRKQNATNQLVARFDEALIRSVRRLGFQGRAVLLAVSGGADSMALLCGLSRVATRLALHIEVATVDHGLRPASANDARFVVDQARQRKCPVHVAHLAVEPGAGVEARARSARYAALHEIRQKQGLCQLVTAHTASDQAETVLMRLMRGSALAGGAAIHAARADFVVRPLLFATRADIERYLRASEVTWRHDTMNDDPSFLRVNIRQSIMPVIERLAAGATKAMARFATLAAEDEAYLGHQAQVALARIRWPDGALDEIALTALERPIARRVMGLFLAEHHLPLDANLIADALAAADQKHDATLPNDQVLRWAQGRLWVAPAPGRYIRRTSSRVSRRSDNS